MECNLHKTPEAEKESLPGWGIRASCFMPEGSLFFFVLSVINWYYQNIAFVGKCGVFFLSACCFM